MKRDIDLIDSLSKILIGLSLITFTTLYAEDESSIKSSIKDYVKLYEPTLYKTIQENGITIDESESSNQESTNSLTSKVKQYVSTNPRKECESKNGILLENRYVATCVSKDGTFGNGYNLLGMTFNPNGIGTVTAHDYLRPGTPWEFFSISLNGKNYFHNNNSGNSNIPTTITPLNRWTPNAVQYHEGGVISSSKIKGANLHITQKYTIDPTAREIIIRVEMYNAGNKPINDLYYARGLDPDQDRPNTFKTLNLRGGNFSELAPIAPNNLVQAYGYKSELSVALYSVDPIPHNTCISNPSWTMNPIDIYTACPVNYNYGDSTINIGFNLGTLKPKERKVFSFKYLFEKRITIDIRSKPNLDTKVTEIAKGK